MSISAKVIEDSITKHGQRITTMQLAYPRFIHAEFLTHRMFSRNASSSRAIPVAKMIEQVETEPATPIHWGKNQPGMQAREELTGDALAAVRDAWQQMAWLASKTALEMSLRGAHKQVVNRLLEPFQIIQVVVTATEWSNFFELRDHEDAQPEIRSLAAEMRRQLYMSAPVIRPNDRLSAAAWHLPYVSADEREAWRDDPRILAMLSTARCARVSYLTHQGKAPSPAADLDLYNKLVGARPLHASPTEHQAYPLPMASQQSNNFRGWRQYRETIEAQFKEAA